MAFFQLTCCSLICEIYHKCHVLFHRKSISISFSRSRSLAYSVREFGKSVYCWCMFSVVRTLCFVSIYFLFIIDGYFYSQKFTSSMRLLVLNTLTMWVCARTHTHAHVCAYTRSFLLTCSSFLFLVPVCRKRQRQQRPR